ncbi:GNAT family N-acetyltransferase [Mesorhizobium sp.]|uniref:GNAT family N-acetyltransferase n=1 Tax=Mesorhizobium sp. TaxID=1871066 RepID=UPI0025EC2116|nr:GNAT family N-acetyltransferase [Mesorhizobium sp.]
MVEITVRDALPADVPFLRDALAKLNDEMETLSGAAGFRAEGFPGLNIEGCLQRDSFLIAVADEEPRGFLSIYFPYPSPDRALVRPRQMAMINTAYVLPPYRRQGIASLLLESTEAKCRTWGATGIHLGFIEGNVAAEAAYRKAGYVTTRRSMLRSLD